MDKPDPGREAPDELTRESLIAISYSEPDKVLSSKLSSEKVNGENVIEEADIDGEEKCRSELISISYQQSPEVECQPLEELEGKVIASNGGYYAKFYRRIRRKQ